MASKTPKTAAKAPEAAADRVAAAVTETALQPMKAAASVANIPAALAATAVEATKAKPGVADVSAKAAAAVKAPVAAAKRTVAKAAAPVVEAVKATVVDPVKKAVETAVTAAPKVVPTAEKDVTFMATQFETPKMFTDVSDRAKAMFSKSQSAVADMGEFGKGNVEAMVESGKIAAKGLETLGQDAADYTRRSFETMTSAFKTLASVKSPTEFFQLQSEYVRSAFDQAVAQSSKTTEAMIKLTSDAAQPLSNRFAVAVEKVKTAA
ncbi:MAG TPA: phasin family protein [Sphingomonas sp.]|nr:phasin family protein [Sphingomonas sp.]